MLTCSCKLNLHMPENARKSPDSPSAGGRAAVSDVMTDDVTHSHVAGSDYIKNLF